MVRWARCVGFVVVGLLAGCSSSSSGQPAASTDGAAESGACPYAGTYAVTYTKIDTVGGCTLTTLTSSTLTVASGADLSSRGWTVDASSCTASMGVSDDAGGCSSSESVIESLQFNSSGFTGTAKDTECYAGSVCAFVYSVTGVRQ